MKFRDCQMMFVPWFFRLCVCLFLALALMDTILPGENTASSPFIVRADWFDRGNAIPGIPYSDKYVCIINGGVTPNVVEYDIDFPTPGTYEVHVLYAAADSRPFELQLDGQVIVEGGASVTGSWSTSSAQWEKMADMNVESPGAHRIQLKAANMFPHICALNFTPLGKENEPWSLPRSTAKRKALELQNDHFKPGPWSDGWYEEVAIDRFEKGESGQTFSDHFAMETSLALVPRENITFSISQKSKLKNEDINHGNICNELTYDASMFSEVPEELNSAGKTLEEADLWAIVHIDIPDREELSKLKKTQDFPLSLEKYSKIISRSQDLIETYRTTQDVAEGFLEQERKRLLEYEKSLVSWQEVFGQTFDSEDETLMASLERFFNEYLDLSHLYSLIARSNPLLDFDEILFVRRHSHDLGLPQNWQSNSVLNPKAFDDCLMALKLKESGRMVQEPTMRVVYKPPRTTFIGDVDLHFDGTRVLASMTNETGRWNVYEIDLFIPGGEAAIQLPPMSDANHYDACYLADDSIMFTSTMPMIGVPCVNGSTPVTNMYRKFNDGTIRRLTFDQDHNWHPALMPDGRVMYQRWEYTDIPHAHARLIFLMNPDGSMQMSHYGTNSYWPNSMFYARPIPEDPMKFVAVVGGHHGVPRMGELVLFDVQKGRSENLGAVQRICGEPKTIESKKETRYESTIIVDNLVDESWPKFLHPFPINEHYYLVSSQPTRESLWGLYLVDTRDNMTLLAESDGFVFFEPLPWKTTPRPPLILDRRDDSKTDAVIHISDIYFGDGLKGVPRGTVKNLRVISYNFLYPNVGGPQGVVGMEGPWDFRTILGTVPVESDGSVAFTVPANLPIALQPLDENGQAIQLMRSWMTAVPGEILACTGCHEDRNSAAPIWNTMPSAGFHISEIKPWYGPARGFSFEREVQPVLNHYCVDCHNGGEFALGITPFDLRGHEKIEGYHSAYHAGYPDAGHFSTSYYHLHRYIRRPGLESDYVMLNPMEFAANTTELVQILRNNHYGLLMDAEAWDRIITWIDLNAPFHGTQGENMGEERIGRARDRRFELMKQYANVDDWTEKIIPASYNPDQAVMLLTTGHSTPFEVPFASAGVKSQLKNIADGGRFLSGKELRERWLNGEKNKEQYQLPFPVLGAGQAANKQRQTGKRIVESVEIGKDLSLDMA
ncbi:MAG: hypothetical protein FWH27_03300, partial [Planctomycetaceae bacterium]|nr:hypothetical protein [Planctomycetaceae bacterium]